MSSAQRAAIQRRGSERKRGPRPSATTCSAVALTANARSLFAKSQYLSKTCCAHPRESLAISRPTTGVRPRRVAPCPARPTIEGPAMVRPSRSARVETPRGGLLPTSRRRIAFNSRFCRGSARQESLYRYAARLPARQLNAYLGTLENTQSSSMLPISATNATTASSISIGRSKETHPEPYAEDSAKVSA